MSVPPHGTASAINRPLLRLISTLQAYATQPVPRPDPLEEGWPALPEPPDSHFPSAPRGGGVPSLPRRKPRLRSGRFPTSPCGETPPHPYNGPPWGPSVPMFADRYLNPEVRAALYHSLPTGHWGAGTLSRWPDPSDTVVIRNPEGHWPFPPSKTFLWAPGAHRIPSNPVAFFTETPFIRFSFGAVRVT